MDEFTPPAPSQRTHAVADGISVAVFMLLFAAACVALTFFGMMLAFLTDSCTDDTCSMGIAVTGMLVAVVGPWLALIGSIVWLIIRFIQHKRLFWVPLAGFGIALAFTIIGTLLAYLGARFG